MHLCPTCVRRWLNPSFVNLSVNWPLFSTVRARISTMCSTATRADLDPCGANTSLWGCRDGSHARTLLSDSWPLPPED